MTAIWRTNARVTARFGRTRHGKRVMSVVREANGFTLIEIMIALAILSTALFVLLEAHYRAMRLFGDASDQVQTNNLMQRAMGIAEAEAMAGSASGHGDFGKRYPDYSYNYQVDNIGGKQQPNFYSVTVTLEGSDNSQKMTLLIFKRTQ